ncbi:MAG TPA: endonuclease/exonuclease/phosphatase family protein [Chitinophagaceae bacterium]|nr:endonuclease/exonuclease/phosphatase family protein [Chitinophagaceae bacterium]
MKCLTLILLFLMSTAHAQQPLQVMTFNIRYNNPGDSANAWPHRVDKVVSQIRFHEVHLLGIQEALHGQVAELQQRLTGFRYVGVGRDDGKERGEYSAIFYDTARLQLLENSTFWLSEQPDVPGSKSWDAAITRIATWALFRDKASGRRFYHFNTHFDHRGVQARTESARLLLKRIAALPKETPVVLTGDLNAEPSTEAVRLLTDAGAPVHLKDAKAESRLPHYGPTGTFNGFGPKENSDQPIDYILLRGPWTVRKHATLSQTWNGRFSSDHFPVLAVVE